MAIDATRSLRHMAWANQRLFAAVASLPVEALASYLVNPDFDVAHILQHLVDGAEWYCFCMTGQHTGWDHVLPTTADDVRTLAAELAAFDEIILQQSLGDDDVLTITNDDGELEQFSRSTVIAQAAHHATEHRAQLVAALDVRGFAAPNLDHLDLWAFEVSERS